MTLENNHINEILALHFSGEKLTDDQEKILVSWVCENKEEYIRLSKVFMASKSSNRMNFNVEQAWNKVDSKLTKAKILKINQFRHYFAYAACIAIVLGISLFFMKKGGNEETLFTNTTSSLLSVVLPDSSRVTLYPQAKVIYLEDTKVKQRKTRLEGKAFFKVKPNKEHPFIVNNNETSIRVLGTSFMVDGVARSETSIFVREGVVQVSTDTDKVILKADEQAVSNGEKIVKSHIENSELLFDNHIIQKAYKNRPLSQVISDIEQEFDIQISINDSIKDIRISTKLKFVNIDEILSEISYICNIQYKKLSDKKFEFYKP